MRKESWVREWNFENFSDEREDEGYKENNANVLDDSSIKKRISISYILEKKLKFHIFSCLKFCFKIPKI